MKATRSAIIAKMPRILRRRNVDTLTNAELFETSDQAEAIEFLNNGLMPVAEFKVNPGQAYWLSLAAFRLRSIYFSRSVTVGARNQVVPSDHLMLVISEHGCCSIEARGTHVSSSNGASAIVSPLDAHVYETADIDEGFVLSADLREIARHMSMESDDRPLRSALARPLHFDLTSTIGSFCRRSILFIWNQLTEPGMPAPPPVLAGAYDELLLNALTSLIMPAVTGNREVDVGSELVRGACELIRAQVAEPIRVADIATMLGVSTRHLQLGFRRHLDTTPQQFLRDCRLELANRMLRNAAPGETVTRIALECGFGHLGEFAALYRRRFGEKPSETIRTPSMNA